MVVADIDAATRGGVTAFVDLLNASPMHQCVRCVNERFGLPFMSKLPSERLPTHQRNLTDARTRIGVLLEYSFGLALQRTLQADLNQHYPISHVTISNGLVHNAIRILAELGSDREPRRTSRIRRTLYRRLPTDSRR